jgi:hypothetical protein
LNYLDFYRFIPRVQFGLAPERQKQQPPQLAQVPVIKVRTESMKARLEEMKRLMKQPKEAAYKPTPEPTPTSRLPISTHQHSRRVPRHPAPTPSRVKVIAHELAPPKTAEPEDADLKAAIAASLADMKEQKKRPKSRLPRRARPNIAAGATDQTGHVLSSKGQRCAQGKTPSRRRVQESRPHLPERQTRPPPVPPRRVPDNSSQLSHLLPISSRRGNHRDPRTGEYLSDGAWNSQIF